MSLHIKVKFSAHVYVKCKMVNVKPSTYVQVGKSFKRVEAMNVEIKMIEKSSTCDTMPKLHNKNVIGVKWVFKIKFNLNSSMNKYR